MKHLIRFFVLVLVLCALSFSSFSVEKETLSTFYNVSGIMFSVGLGLIVSLNYSDVKNKNYLTSIRQNISKIRNIFILYFMIITVLFLFIGKDISINLCFSKISYDVIFSVFSIYTIIYFIVNFLQIQRLNDDISDKKNQEEEK